MSSMDTKCLTYGLIIFIGLVDGYWQRELPCQQYEILSCGDPNSRYRWQFCRPKLSGTDRIISVHLDVRFANRYCRMYGKPQHFGLTVGGGQMWVMDFCFGTFLLCFDDVPTTTDSYETTYETASLQSNLNGLSEHTGTDLVDLTDLPETTTTGGSTTSDTFTQLPTTQEGHTNKYNVKEDIVEETTTNTSVRIQRFLNESMQFESNLNIKAFLMAAIVAGGAVLIGLILTIAYLTLNCDIKRAKNSNSQRYFREAKHSTSALVTTEHPSDQSVYDFIPCDMQIQYGLKTNTPIGKSKEQSSDSKSADPNTNYFILQPQDTVTKHTSLDAFKVYSHVHVENEYDHLKPVPRTYVSDNSTYSHLGAFLREPLKCNENGKRSKRSNTTEEVIETRSGSKNVDIIKQVRETHEIEKADIVNIVREAHEIKNDDIIENVNEIVRGSNKEDIIENVSETHETEKVDIVNIVREAHEIKNDDIIENVNEIVRGSNKEDIIENVNKSTQAHIFENVIAPQTKTKQADLFEETSEKQSSTINVIQPKNTTAYKYKYGTY